MAAYIVEKDAVLYNLEKLLQKVGKTAAGIALPVVGEKALEIRRLHELHLELIRGFPFVHGVAAFP